MDEIEWIRSLDRARAHAPRVDVADRVMLVVRSQRHEHDDVFPFAALLATLAGVAAILMALPMWAAAQDPLAGFADGFQMVLQ